MVFAKALGDDAGPFVAPAPDAPNSEPVSTVASTPDPIADPTDKPADAPAEPHGYAMHDEHESAAERTEHYVHRLHQAKVGAHTVHEAGEGAEAIRLGNEARNGLAETVDGSGKLLRSLGGTANAIESLNAQQAARLTEAAQTLKGLSSLQKTATLASARQSTIARTLARAMSQGAEPATILALRTQLAEASRAANTAQEAVRDAQGAAKVARATIRAVGAELSEAQRGGSLARAAFAAIRNSRTGEMAVQLARTAAESRVGAVVAAIGTCKYVKVGGRVLVVAAVAIDAFLATNPHATVNGNTFRFVAQAGASTILYTQPVLLPVLFAEAFVAKGPHATGTIAAAVQAGAIPLDYVTGGVAVGDRALFDLDKEMKGGKYGAVVKGANLLGQIGADEGWGSVMGTTFAYWSKVSPKTALRDAKQVWDWLTDNS